MTVYYALQFTMSLMTFQLVLNKKATHNPICRYLVIVTCGNTYITLCCLKKAQAGTLTETEFNKDWLKLKIQQQKCPDFGYVQTAGKSDLFVKSDL